MTASSGKRTAFEQVVLLLQGGGALGSYQGGVYQALAEADLHPDWVAGISIGAFNAAIIAGNPPERRVERLREFWETVSKSPLGFYSEAFNLKDDLTHEALSQAYRARSKAYHPDSETGSIDLWRTLKKDHEDLAEWLRQNKVVEGACPGGCATPIPGGLPYQGAPIYMGGPGIGGPGASVPLGSETLPPPNGALTMPPRIPPPKIGVDEGKGGKQFELEGAGRTGPVGPALPVGSTK